MATLFAVYFDHMVFSESTLSYLDGAPIIFRGSPIIRNILEFLVESKLIESLIINK